jgi:hypothetical protein
MTHCPICRKQVGAEHYACVKAAAAGHAGTGASKRRDIAHYQMMGRKSGEAKRRNAEARKQGKG